MTIAGNESWVVPPSWRRSLHRSFFILCRLSLLLLPFCHFEFPGVHRAGQGSRIRRFRRRIHDTTWNFSWHLSSFISWYLFSIFSFSKLFYRLPNFTEYFSEPSFRPRLPTYFLSLRQGTRIGNMSGMNTAITYSIQNLENIWKHVWWGKKVDAFLQEMRISLWTRWERREEWKSSFPPHLSREDSKIVTATTGTDCVYLYLYLCHFTQ